MRQPTLALAAATLAAVGCVDRRFVVETNPPAAQVFVDGESAGVSPADGRYEYTGYRTIQAVAPGYETTTERVRFKPRWWDYPPLDLVAEILPIRFEDVRRVRLDLTPAQPVNQAALVSGADALRARGKAMRESVVPDTPRDRPPPAPAPLPPASLTPIPVVGGEPGSQPQPPGGPILGPQTAPGR